MNSQNPILGFFRYWDRIFFYATLLFLAVFFLSFRNDVRQFSGRVEQDTRFLRRVAATPSVIDVVWVARLAHRMTDPQAFVRPPARNLFAVLRDEVPVVAKYPKADADEFSRASKKQGFSLVKIYRQPVKLLFKGYLQLPDGSFSLQINWAGQTDFKEVGETIRGYRIERFEKVVGTKEIQNGLRCDVDNSYVIIHKEPAPPITLNKGTMMSEKELFAKISDGQSGNITVAHVGSKIRDYKVLDITEDEVLLSNTADEKTVLKRAR